jgi:hypothetical protein
VIERRDNAGLFLAFVGIPGSGKSTLAREFASLVGGQAFIEPDEWGPAVSNRDRCGRFTALQWFRSGRVPNYYEAERIARGGGVAVLDSYYDKLCHAWLGSPGMEWLIDSGDSYFEVALQVAELDWRLLPSADVIVIVRVDEATWRQFLRSRGRALDEVFDISSTFDTETLYGRAAERLARTTAVRTVEFKQTFSSARQSAIRLLDELKAAGVQVDLPR